MKIDKHEAWQALTQLTLMCLKYIKGMVSLNVTWHSYYLIPWQSFHRNKAKLWRNFFFSYGNAICSILVKYQEIYVQIHLKHSTQLLF